MRNDVFRPPPAALVRVAPALYPPGAMGNVLLDADGMERALDQLAGRIASDVPKGVPVGVIGIRSRGDILAARLIPRLARLGVNGVASGVLDITLYRDDLAEKGPNAILQKTEIDFDLNGCYIILVDDVLYTGRSVRAALDALADLGRPLAIRLAILVDRPGRELPIQADFVGIAVTHVEKTVNVMLREKDGRDCVEVL
jgi:pyrimidine operon attenuation protein/uracil phosphoribosyltransferase